MSTMKKLLESLDELGAHPMGPMGGHSLPAPEVDRGNPVTMNISMNASGKEHVEDLINMMKNAGLGGAKEVTADMMPMRMDMERLRDIVDEPGDEDPNEAMDEGPCEDCGCDPCECEDKDVEEWANSPEGSEDEAEYRDQAFMTNTMGDDLHKKKRMYKAASQGDNAMAAESIKKQLLAALAEKKANKDYDGDGKIESPKDEYMGSKDKAIKKSMAKKK